MEKLISYCCKWLYEDVLLDESLVYIIRGKRNDGEYPFAQKETTTVGVLSNLKRKRTLINIPRKKTPRKRDDNNRYYHYENSPTRLPID